MRILGIALIALAIMGTMASEEDDTYYTLQQIEKTKFGKTLLDTIQLELSNGGPVEDLIDMLKDIEEEMENAQDEDDEYIQVVQAQCDNELSTLQSEINAAEARATELQTELDEKIPLRDERVRQHEEALSFKALIEAKIVELDQNMQLKDEEWASEQEEHDKAQYTIERAKELIAGAMGSFLQKKANVAPEVFVQVSEHFSQ